MNTNSIINFVYSAHIYLSDKPFIYLIYLFLVLVIYIYTCYYYMEKNGFNRENSLDTSLLTTGFLVFPMVYLYISAPDLSFFTFFITNSHFWIILLTIFVLYVKAKFSRWSFYKILDIFAISLSLVLFYIYLILSFLYLNPLFIVPALIYFLLYKSSQKQISGASINYFLIFKIKKHESFSFIGAVGLMFIIYTLLLGVIMYVYNFRELSNSSILLLALFVICNYVFVKRASKNQVLWTLIKTSSKKMKLNFSKKENKLF